MKKGDVYLVQLPAGQGHAQAGQRPAIILQDQVYNRSLPTTLFVPLTSTLSVSRFDGTLVIQPDNQNGLTTPSVVMVFQMRTLDQRDCLKWLGTIDEPTLDRIFAVLDQLLGRQRLVCGCV